MTQVETDAKMWLLVADAGRARLFSADRAVGALTEIQDIVSPEARLRDQDLARDRPGRTFDRGGEGRHAMEPSTAPSETEAIRFAKDLGEILDQGRVDGRFLYVALIAPPQFLGHLRKSISAETAKQVVLEIDKDFTRDDAATLRERLPERLYEEGL